MSDRVVRRFWVATAFVAALAVIWFSRRILIMLFAGLLIALIITSLINLLRKVIPLGHKALFGIVLLLMAGLVWGGIMLIAPTISQQFSELADQLPKLVTDLIDKIQKSTIFRRVEGILPNLGEMMPSGGGVGRLFSSTFEAVSTIIFIGFTAIFLAATPGVYRRFVIKLFPPRLRGEAERCIIRIICTLKYWLLGQFVSMSVVGVVVGVSLAIVGVPFAAALGIVAGLAEFIPILGPILASIPALLIAASLGAKTFLIVLIIFLILQFLEGNVLTPIVQRRAIDLPPVITLTSLLVLGSSFGLLGMFVAAPFAGMVIVLIEEIYLRGQLGTEERLLT